MKRVFITGVSGGIGRALAERFLEKGFFVAGAGRNRPDLDSENFVFYKNDFENYREICVDFPLDVVVLNSGKTAYKKLSDAEVEDIESVFKVNFFGNLLTLKSLLPFLEKGGVVSFVSSIASLEENDFPFWGLYSSSKIALEKALRVFSKEEGFKLIIFNPGRVDTAIWNSVYGKERELPRRSPFEVAAVMEREIEKALSDSNFAFKRVIIG